jgi:hypothetical protein
VDGLDSDTPGVALYVAPSAGGPWSQVTMSDPPWIISRDIITSIASAQGVATYQDLWLKAGENNGRVFLLGSMIDDREFRMPELCGVQ